MGLYLTNQRRPRITRGATRKPPNTNKYRQDKKLQDRYHETRSAVLTWDLLTISWSMNKGLIFTCSFSSQTSVRVLPEQSWSLDTGLDIRIERPGFIKGFSGIVTSVLQWPHTKVTVYFYSQNEALFANIPTACPHSDLFINGIIKEFNWPKGAGKLNYFSF